MPPTGIAERGAYRELTPPPHLADSVLCFWYRAPSTTPATATIIPDGCLDIIWKTGQPPLVAGAMTVPIRTMVESRSGVVGIRFRPGAGQILGVNASELRDQHVPLRSIWRHQEIASWEAVTVEGPLPRTLGEIARVLTCRLGAIHGPDRFVIEAANWIAAHPFGSVDTLSHLSGLSQRQVRRRFDQAIGFGPKMLQRVLRLQYLLWLASLRRDGDLGLARLALAAGYADQPHMTRDVLTFTGASPRQLLLASAPRSAVSGLFLSHPQDLAYRASEPEFV